MPYGKSRAILEETPEGRQLTVKIKLPDVGEPSKSGRATNLTDSKEWIDVVDEFGMPTPIQVVVTACVPHRRAAELRRRGEQSASVAPSVVRRPLM